MAKSETGRDNVTRTLTRDTYSKTIWLKRKHKHHCPFLEFDRNNCCQRLPSNQAVDELAEKIPNSTILRPKQSPRLVLSSSPSRIRALPLTHVIQVPLRSQGMTRTCGFLLINR